MVGDELELLEFDRVMNYAFRIADRHKREIALIMLHGEQKAMPSRPKLTRFFRRCDEVAEFKGCAAVMLTETDARGAERAIERFKTTHTNGSLPRFGVASFPSDGGSAQVVFKTAYRRLNVACEVGPGAVVANG